MSRNLTEKLPAQQYYIHSSFVNVYYYVYKFLEQWIASNIFRGDISRVFMASDDYAFRRRFELTDTSKSYEDLEFSSLRFPFANYFPQNDGWVTDDRLAAKSAALTYLGIYEENTKVKASASIINIPVTFWFDREDDARLAYEILYFKSYNEQYNTTRVPYGRNNTLNDSSVSQSSNIIELPINFKIRTLQFNPQFTETDWLKKQRVFPLKVAFDVRTFVLYPPAQPSYDMNVDANGTLDDGSSYEDGYNYYYLVDRVILNTSNIDNYMETYDAGYNVVDNTYSGPESFPTVGISKTLYVDSYKEEFAFREKAEGEEDREYELAKQTAYHTWLNTMDKIYVWDELNNRYIKPDTELDYSTITIMGTCDNYQLGIKKFDFITKVGETSNILSWEFEEEEFKKDGTTGKIIGLKNIVSLEIHLLNNCEVYIISNPEVGNYIIENLRPGTQYFGYAIFKAKDETYKKFVMNFRTTREVEVQAESKPNSLVGLSW